MHAETKQPVPLWLSIFDESKTVRNWFKCAIILYGAAVYLFLIFAIHTGRPEFAVLGELMASNLPVNLMGWLYEDRGEWTIECYDGVRRNQLQRRLDPRVQSWAFLADLVGVAPMLAFAALTYPHLPHFILFNGAWWAQALWVVLPVAPAIFGSWSFRKGETDEYDPLRYFSFTKLLHNGVAFSVLFAVIIHVLPMLFTGLIFSLVTGHYLVALWASLGLLGLAIWGAAAFGDGKRGETSRYPLVAKLLHRQVDKWGRGLPEEITDIPTMAGFWKEDPARASIWTDVFHTRKLMPRIQRLRGRKQEQYDPVPSGTNQELSPTDYDERQPQEWTGDGPNKPG